VPGPLDLPVDRCLVGGVCLASALQSPDALKLLSAAVLVAADSQNHGGLLLDDGERMRFLADRWSDACYRAIRFVSV